MREMLKKLFPLMMGLGIGNLIAVAYIATLQARLSLHTGAPSSQDLYWLALWLSSLICLPAVGGALTAALVSPRKQMLQNGLLVTALCVTIWTWATWRVISVFWQVGMGFFPIIAILAAIGGGYIFCRLAQHFNGLSPIDREANQKPL